MKPRAPRGRRATDDIPDVASRPDAKIAPHAAISPAPETRFPPRGTRAILGVLARSCRPLTRRTRRG